MYYYEPYIMTISEVKYRQISVNSYGLSKIVHVQIVCTCRYINTVYTCVDILVVNVISVYMYYTVLWKWKLLSHVQLFATQWTVAWQAPLSMEFSRPDSWSGQLFPSAGDLPTPGTEPRSILYHIYCVILWVISSPVILLQPSER